MTERKLHFFTDSRLCGRKTNVFTRKKMIDGFTEIEDVENLVVHYVVSSREEKHETVEKLQRDNIEARPIYLPGFSSKSDSFLYSFYKILVLNRILDIIYLWDFITDSEPIKYVWGMQPTLAAIFSHYLHRNSSFILELDDHMFGKDKLEDYILLQAASSAITVSTVSEQTKEDLIERGIEREKITVLPNAVDFERFNIDNEQENLREQLNIPQDRFLVTYTGHLYSWKGIETLIEAGKILQEEDVKILLVGGNQKDVDMYREVIENRGLEGTVQVVGYVSRKKVPIYQNASDALVVPNTGKSEKAKKYTSPVKLREYMASETPIIVSKLPSIQNAVSDKEVFYFTPDDPEDLADKISLLKESSEKAEKKSKRAMQKAREYGWKDRADRILKNALAKLG